MSPLRPSTLPNVLTRYICSYAILDLQPGAPESDIKVQFRKKHF